MNFEDRKKLIEKHRRLANKSQEQIDNNPFVLAKRKLISKHNDAIKELLEGCTHEEVEKKSRYFSGSYYDKASTDYWNECKLCGATSEITSETHGWYG
jgi:hypothetical protein